MKYEQIKEGKAKLDVPLADVVSKDLPVFYNPEMKMNRDLSLLLLKTIEKNELQVALPLAGSGVRALRILLELPKEKIKHVYVNDYDSEAVANIQANVALNKIKTDKLTVTQEDAEKFLEQGMGFDYIDIDPFGSPNFLLDATCKRISREGIIAVTATDTGALAGSFPEAGKMKYWATTHLMPQKHELALRILARKVMLIATQHSKALTPILSYHHKHYYRVFFKVEKSKTKAAEAFDKLTTYYGHCDNCAWSGTRTNTAAKCPGCSFNLDITGPLYSGEIQDRVLMQKLLLGSEDKTMISMLESLLDEQECSEVGFFDTHELCKLQKKDLLKVSEIISQLEESGYTAVQASTQKTGVKTNASFKEVLATFSKK